MSPAEMAWRLRDRVVRAAWSPRQVLRHQLARAVAAPAREPAFTGVLPPDTAARVPEEARTSVLQAADRLLEGEWESSGVLRTERVWELSRLQHLTLLATAWYLTHDERYARRVAGHLRYCWRADPFLSRAHRTSGIELGIRLSSLAWIRRLLNDWPGVAGLFERDALALRQIRRHQQYLAAFRSRGSSASDHVIAEAAGQLAVSCALPWFPESERWRRKSALLLERELGRNTFPSGIGREPAPDFHCAVIELGLVAAVEADVSGHPLRAAAWVRLCALADSAAALADESLRPSRQDDSDESRGLLLDAPAPNYWPSMLALARALVGQQDWWPQPPANAISAIVGALAGSRRQIAGRPSQRPSHFAEAGITLLRTRGKNEIWCRCERGPHGYRGIAAHAHADTLSVEVRYAGIDILADPGTSCYHGRRAWRSYFRPAIARHARTREIEVLDDGDIARWTAEHDGYASLDPLALHRRSVLLDRASRSIDIIDQIEGDGHDIRLAFHLGPDVHVELEESCAVLDWPTAASTSGTSAAARLELPPGLRWSLHQGETDSVPGGSPHGPGRRVPAVVLLGCGPCVPEMPLITRLEFLDVGKSGRSGVSAHAISWTTPAALLNRAPDIRAEAR
jgi:Heparinase II/III-like protein/Heparinase II/III N-terminus